MGERQPLTRQQIADRFAADSLLADFVTPFPNLLTRGQTGIAGSFERMARLLKKGDRAALIQFTIRDGREVRRWCLTLTPDGCKVSEDESGRPDLEILTAAEVWTQIAGGKLSPLEAFGQGQLRVRGDIALARFLVTRLHDR